MFCLSLSEFVGVLVSTWGRCPDPCLNASHLISSHPSHHLCFSFWGGEEVSRSTPRGLQKSMFHNHKIIPNQTCVWLLFCPPFSSLFFSNFLLLKCFLFFHFFICFIFPWGERTPQHEDETRSTLTSISMSNPVLHCPSLIGTCQAFLVIKSVRERVVHTSV